MNGFTLSAAYALRAEQLHIVGKFDLVHDLRAYSAIDKRARHGAEALSDTAMRTLPIGLDGANPQHEGFEAKQ